MATTLSLKRSGSFTATPEQMTVHACEGKDKREFRYEVEIVTKGQNLTPEGFILDTQRVMDYFREKYGERKDEVESCEMVAKRATDYFANIFVQGRVYSRLSAEDIERMYRGDLTYIPKPLEKYFSPDLLRISVTISTHDESSFTATFENN